MRTFYEFHYKKKLISLSFFLACISNKLLNNKTHKFIQVPNIYIYPPQSKKLIQQVGEERWFWIVWRLLHSACCFMKKVEAKK
jgi:hypothetical protein